jgi:hypothetical protein
MTSPRFSFTAIAIVWLISICSPLSARPQSKLAEAYQDGTDQSYVWCWAAELRSDPRDHVTHYYMSDIFPAPARAHTPSGPAVADFDMRPIAAAFGAYVRATYPDDFKAAGIGSSECSSAVNYGSAHGAFYKFIEGLKGHGLLKETDWTYKAKAADKGYWYKCYMTVVSNNSVHLFQSSPFYFPGENRQASDDQIYESWQTNFKRRTESQYPGAGNLPTCGAFESREDAAKLDVYKTYYSSPYQNPPYQAPLPVTTIEWRPAQ